MSKKRQLRYKLNSEQCKLILFSAFSPQSELFRIRLVYCVGHLELAAPSLLFHTGANLSPPVSTVGSANLCMHSNSSDDTLAHVIEDASNFR